MCDDMEQVHISVPFCFFYIGAFFYKNEAQIWPKIKNNVRTIPGWGLESLKAKFTFLNKIILFFSNSTVSSVELLQMLRSIEFPLRFIPA